MLVDREAAAHRLDHSHTHLIVSFEDRFKTAAMTILLAEGRSNAQRERWHVPPARHDP
jgi:hypothetical protein